MGDWFATLGKDGMEKNAVLAERKANRVAACAKREAEKAAKKVQQAGSDMKKKMGFLRASMSNQKCWSYRPGLFYFLNPTM